MKQFFIQFRSLPVLLLMISGLFIIWHNDPDVSAQAPSSKILASPNASPTPKEVARRKEPLSLDQFFKALRSDKASQTEINQILIRGVKERGISFILTPEVEAELSEQGAGKALIETIREETERLQASSVYYRNLADDFSYKSNYAEAIVNYNKALELDPNDRAAYNNRGLVFERMNRVEEAYADFTKVIELDPTDRNGYHNRGVIYYKKGEYQKAISDYTRSIDLDPNFKEAYVHRAAAYQLLGQKDQAEADRRKAKELEKIKSF